MLSKWRRTNTADSIAHARQNVAWANYICYHVSPWQSCHSEEQFRQGVSQHSTEKCQQIIHWMQNTILQWRTAQDSGSQEPVKINKRSMKLDVAVHCSSIMTCTSITSSKTYTLSMLSICWYTRIQCFRHKEKIGSFVPTKGNRYTQQWEIRSSSQNISSSVSNFPPNCAVSLDKT